MTHAYLDSPIGGLRLHSNGHSITEIDFDAAPADDDTCDPVLESAIAQLGEYFAGTRTGFDLPLDPAGSAFQKSVWAELAKIPYGETASYGAIAARLGLRPVASRAVGSANGANPIPIVVPCHRVIGADGSLTGYAGGLERKQQLLSLEQPALF